MAQLDAKTPSPSAAAALAASSKRKLSPTASDERPGIISRVWSSVFKRRKFSPDADSSAVAGERMNGCDETHVDAGTDCTVGASTGKKSVGVGTTTGRSPLPPLNLDEDRLGSGGDAPAPASASTLKQPPVVRWDAATTTFGGTATMTSTATAKPIATTRVDDGPQPTPKARTNGSGGVAWASPFAAATFSIGSDSSKKPRAAAASTTPSRRVKGTALVRTTPSSSSRVRTRNAAPSAREGNRSILKARASRYGGGGAATRVDGRAGRIVGVRYRPNSRLLTSSYPRRRPSAASSSTALVAAGGDGKAKSEMSRALADRILSESRGVLFRDQGQEKERNFDEYEAAKKKREKEEGKAAIVAPRVRMGRVLGSNQAGGRLPTPFAAAPPAVAEQPKTPAPASAAAAPPAKGVTFLSPPPLRSPAAVPRKPEASTPHPSAAAAPEPAQRPIIAPTPSKAVMPTPRRTGMGERRYVGTPLPRRRSSEDDEFPFTPSKPVEADETTDAVEADCALEENRLALAGKKKVAFDFSSEVRSPQADRERRRSGAAATKKPRQATPHPSRKRGDGDGTDGDGIAAGNVRSGAAPFSFMPGGATAGTSPAASSSSVGFKFSASSSALAPAKAPAPAPAASAAKKADEGKTKGNKPKSTWGANMFRKTDEWKCGACLTSNPKTAKNCLACDEVKPGMEVGAASGGKKEEPKKAGDTAKVATNGAIGSGGFSFGVASSSSPGDGPSKPSSAPNFSFGATPAPSDKKDSAAAAASSGFIFGGASSGASSAEEKKDGGAKGSGFVFGGTPSSTSASAGEKRDGGKVNDAAPEAKKAGLTFGAPAVDGPKATTESTAATTTSSSTTTGSKVSFTFGVSSAATDDKKNGERKESAPTPTALGYSFGGANSSSSTTATYQVEKRVANDDPTSAEQKKPKRVRDEASAKDKVQPTSTPGLAFGSSPSSTAKATPSAPPEKTSLSFGQSSASSAPAASTPPFPVAPKPSFGAEETTPATMPSKFAFGSAVQNTATPAPAAASSANTPAFSFGASSAAGPATAFGTVSEDGTTSKKKRRGGVAGSNDTSADTSKGAPSTPAFTFGAAPVPAATPSIQVASSSATPAFTFGGGSSSTPAPATSFGTSSTTPAAPATSTPGFSFGGGSASNAAATPTASQPTFSFGGSAAKPAAAPSATPAFAFGSAAAPAAPAAATPGGPGFSFGSATTAKVATSGASFAFGAGTGAPPASGTATPAFAFGASAGAAPTATQQPSFGGPAGGGGFGTPATPAQLPGGMAGGPQFSIGTGGSSKKSGPGGRRIVKARRPPGRA